MDENNNFLSYDKYLGFLLNLTDIFILKILNCYLETQQVYDVTFKIAGMRNENIKNIYKN